MPLYRARILFLSINVRPAVSNSLALFTKKNLYILYGSNVPQFQHSSYHAVCHRNNSFRKFSVVCMYLTSLSRSVLKSFRHGSCTVLGAVIRKQLIHTLPVILSIPKVEYTRIIRITQKQQT